MPKSAATICAMGDVVQTKKGGHGHGALAQNAQKTLGARDTSTSTYKKGA